MDPNLFANDGSFMEMFRRLQEQKSSEPQELVREQREDEHVPQRVPSPGANVEPQKEPQQEAEYRAQRTPQSHEEAYERGNDAKVDKSLRVADAEKLPPKVKLTQVAER